MNLSNRSINLLKSDNVARYKWYVLNIREDTFETYFALGKAFASSVESFHKTGDRQLARHAENMEKEFIQGWVITEYPKYLQQLEQVINNAKLVINERCANPEFEAKIKINEKYTLKSKYDALRDDYIEDYKTVSDLSKDKEWYRQQIEIYQYSEYKRTGKKMKWIITEIKKWKATLPTKKDDLIALIPEWIDNTGTIDVLRERLHLHTRADQVTRQFTFDRDDEIITRTESLLKKAMLKADYLQSLSFNDVL